MDILINELSLHNQFRNKEEFEKEGLIPLVSILSELDKNRDIIYKKSDLYNYKPIPRKSLHSILIGEYSRRSDIIRKFKRLLFNYLLSEPYWDLDSKQKHSSEDDYSYKGKNINNSSIAEACERDRVIISFNSVNFNENSLVTHKNISEEIGLDNLLNGDDYNELCKEKNLINIKEYCINRFGGESGKLDFSKINENHGFNLIEKEDEGVFY